MLEPLPQNSFMSCTHASIQKSNQHWRTKWGMAPHAAWDASSIMSDLLALPWLSLAKVQWSILSWDTAAQSVQCFNLSQCCCVFVPAGKYHLVAQSILELKSQNTLTKSWGHTVWLLAFFDNILSWKNHKKISGCEFKLVVCGEISTPIADLAF